MTRTPAQQAFMRRTRAQAALTAYTTALDYVRRLPHDEIVRRLEAKIEQKREECE